MEVTAPTSNNSTMALSCHPSRSYIGAADSSKVHEKADCRQIWLAPRLASPNMINPEASRHYHNLLPYHYRWRRAPYRYKWRRRRHNHMLGGQRLSWPGGSYRYRAMHGCCRGHRGSHECERVRKDGGSALSVSWQDRRVYYADVCPNIHVYERATRWRV